MYSQTSRDNSTVSNAIRIAVRTAAVMAAAIIMMILLGSAEGFAAVRADCEYLPGNNIGDNDYSRWSSTVDSYITAKDGGYMKVQGGIDGMGVAVAYYDSDYNILSRKELAAELPVFGGFYESSSNYFIVTGQDNTEENNNKQVYRITKYDKNWNRLGSCGLNGANTIHPFDAGSCRMAMSGNYLLIRTCHTMYTTSDGLNHQANVTIEVNTSTMQVTNSATAISSYRTGYVSHSFNQFIKLDSNKIVAVDHGDAGDTRGIVLLTYPTDVTTGSFASSSVSAKIVLNVPDSDANHHYNITGASVGAFEITGSTYLIAGNSVTKNGMNIANTTRNIYVLAVNKSNKSVSTKWLTSYSEGTESATTPHMVRITNSKYMVLWSRGGKIYYVYIDANGNMTSSIYEKAGSLSDCAPVVINGYVTWYTWEDHEESLYRISVNDPSNMTVKNVYFDHDPEIIQVLEGLATFKCKKCGETLTGRVPTSFDVWWKNAKIEEYSYSRPMMDMIEEGESAEYKITENYDATTGKKYNEFVIELADPVNSILDKEKKQIKFLKAGTYDITFYPKYNPSLKQIETIKVVKELESVSLNASATDIGFDEWIDIDAVTEGGRGSLTYTFTARAPDGTVSTIYEGWSDGRGWSPEAVGTWQVAVKVKDSYDNKEAASNTVTVNVAPAEVAVMDGRTIGAYDLELGSKVSDIYLYNDSFVNKKTGFRVDGTLTFDDPDAVLPVGTHEVGFTFRPEKSGYLEYKGTVTVKVVDYSSGYDDDYWSDDYWSGDDSGNGDGSGGGIYWDEDGNWHFIPEDGDDQTNDRYEQMGADGTAFGKGAALEAAENAMYRMNGDRDPAGTKFAPLNLKSTKQSKKSIKLTWKSVSGARKYIIYANRCGRGYTLLKLKTLGASVRSFTAKKAGWDKIRKGKYYKFMVIAVDGNNDVVTSSRVIHVATPGGKVRNPKKVKVSKASLRKAKRLNMGGSFKLGASYVPKKRVKKHTAVRYESSNRSVATVDRKGCVKGIKSGSAVIYAYAQNGVCKAVKVTVR